MPRNGPIIVADGKSHFARYLNFLLNCTSFLVRLSERNRKAERLVAMPIEEQLSRRSTTIKWHRHHVDRNPNKRISSPRIWTRRDVRWLDWKQKQPVEPSPGRRINRVFAYVNQQHWTLLQLAANETGGPSSVVAPRLKACSEIWKSLLDSLLSCERNGDSHSTNFSSQQLDLYDNISELKGWLPPPKAKKRRAKSEKPKDKKLTNDEEIALIKDWEYNSKQEVDNRLLKKDFVVPFGISVDQMDRILNKHQKRKNARNKP